jgi:hypothetical protein
MVNEIALREALLSVVDLIKTQTEKIASLEIEISAVKETVGPLDPAFDEALAAKRQTIRERVFPSYAGAVGTLQRLTQKMTNELIS